MCCVAWCAREVYELIVYVRCKCDDFLEQPVFRNGKRPKRNAGPQRY